MRMPRKVHVLWKLSVLLGIIFVTAYFISANEKYKLYSYIYQRNLSDSGNVSYKNVNTKVSAQTRISTPGISTEPVCVEKNVSLSKTPLPLTGLVSFPGSGNTWVRHLIQQMTGIGTSSVYCDGSLRTKGFPHECDFRSKTQNRTIVVKTHELGRLKRMQKAVLLIRNPYEAFMAYANFAKAGHTGHASNKTLLTASNKMFNHSCHWYVDLSNKTLNLDHLSVYVLQYETLKSDMQNELRELAKFLDVNVTETDIYCTVKLQEGLHHRQTSTQARMEALRGVYDDKKLRILKSVVSNIEGILEERFHRKYDIGGHIQKDLFE